MSVGRATAVRLRWYPKKSDCRSLGFSQTTSHGQMFIERGCPFLDCSMLGGNLTPMEGARMKSISLVLMVCAAVLLPGLAFAQYGYVRECKETVANQLNVSTLDVSAQLGPYSQNGNRIVNWRSRRAGNSNGYCEFRTATGELVRAESGNYAGHVVYRQSSRGTRPAHRVPR